MKSLKTIYSQSIRAILLLVALFWSFHTVAKTDLSMMLHNQGGYLLKRSDYKTTGQVVTAPLSEIKTGQSSTMRIQGGDELTGFVVYNVFYRTVVNSINQDLLYGQLVLLGYDNAYHNYASSCTSAYYVSYWDTSQPAWPPSLWASSSLGNSVLSGSHAFEVDVSGSSCSSQKPYSPWCDWNSAEFQRSGLTNALKQALGLTSNDAFPSYPESLMVCLRQKKGSGGAYQRIADVDFKSVGTQSNVYQGDVCVRDQNAESNDVPEVCSAGL